MTQREKLVELLDEIHRKPLGKEYCERLGTIADYLLANGVIVPPCEVGDIVYVANDYGYKKEIKKYEVGCIVIRGTNDISKELWEDRFGGVIGSFEDFEKTLFCTKEEAEKALTERKANEE